MTLDTRGKIVSAAMRLFAVQGYERTSVAEILAAAQVNSGSLYYFFPSKQDVLTAVLELYLEGIGPMLLQPAWGAITDPFDRVYALLESYRARLLNSRLKYGCPIGSIALELHDPNIDVRRRLHANFRAWAAAVEQCLIEAGPRLPSHVDRHDLAVLALTTMEGGVMLSRTSRRIDEFDAAIRSFRAYLECLESTVDLERPRRPRKRRAGKSASAHRR